MPVGWLSYLLMAPHRRCNGGGERRDQALLPHPGRASAGVTCLPHLLCALDISLTPLSPGAWHSPDDTWSPCPGPARGTRSGLVKEGGPAWRQAEEEPKQRDAIGPLLPSTPGWGRMPPKPTCATLGWAQGVGHHHFEHSLCSRDTQDIPPPFSASWTISLKDRGKERE